MIFCYVQKALHPEVTHGNDLWPTVVFVAFIAIAFIFAFCYREREDVKEA